MIFSFPSNQLNSINQNAPGSLVASQYGQDTSILTALRIRKLIFNAAPKDYIDLKLLMMNTPRVERDYEFTYLEKQYQRKSVIATPTATISAGVAQTIPISNPQEIAVDFILVHPVTEQKVTVNAVDPNAFTMGISALIGESLPQLTSGTTYLFPLHSSVDGDMANKITQMYRLNNLVQRTNFVQSFVRGTSFGEIERFKYEQNGTTNYMDSNREELLTQYRIDLSNSYWNGTRGMVTLSSGQKALLMDGVVPSMLRAGCLQVSCSPSQIFEATRAAMHETRFGSGNYDRYLYGTPKWLDKIASIIKQPFQRFTATGDNGMEIQLNYVSLGSGNLVFVPVQRFEQKSNSFPASWENQLILMNQDSVNPVITLPERMGGLLSRRQGNTSTLNSFSIEYIEGTLSQEYNNPLEGALIHVS